MWQARNKTDLIIEVWEKLDCESIGRAELEAIEAVVEDVFGKAAADTPMIVARLLADEGAQLRHAEIMNLHVERASDRPYDAAFRNLIDITDLAKAERSIRDLENLRQNYKAGGDSDGLRRIRESAIDARKSALDTAEDVRTNEQRRKQLKETADWLRVWLETPDVFVDWLSVRKTSAGFRELFG